MNPRLLLLLLLQERLLHIPSWSWHGGGAGSDEVICISELKMSIMGQNCLAPGVVTLLANLIKPHRFKVGNFCFSNILSTVMLIYTGVQEVYNMSFWHHRRRRRRHHHYHYHKRVSK